MRKSRGFTLIEVLVATTIVSIVIVWAFLLLSSATRQWDRVKLEKNAEEVELWVRACIGSLPFSYLASIPSGTSVAVNFGSGNLSCATGSYDSSLTFTGITLSSYSGTGTDAQTKGWSSFYQAFFSIGASPTGSANEKIVTQKIISVTGERTLEWSVYGE